MATASGAVRGGRCRSRRSLGAGARGVTGALLGLLVGVGLLLMWTAWNRPAKAVPTSPRMTEQLAQAGMPGVRPEQLYAVCAGLAFVIFVVVAGLSHAA